MRYWLWTNGRAARGSLRRGGASVIR
jgi:hypothetical protein